MHVVDSSGWLAFFAGEPNATFFQAPLSKPAELLVPSICIHEVYKVIHRQLGEEAALKALAAMNQGHLVELDSVLAVHAAEIGLTQGLATADSIVYATALLYDATLWTQDADFSGKPGVKYRRK